MNKYRIYVDFGKGFEFIGCLNKIDMINLLDRLIYVKHKGNKILVIEQSEISSFPIFEYLGRVEEYEVFKEMIMSKKKQKN